MLLYSSMNWFNMIFKVNKSFERSTTSTTVMLLFFLHEPMHYDFQNQSYSQNQHYICTIMLLLSFMNWFNMTFEVDLTNKFSSIHLTYIFLFMSWCSMSYQFNWFRKQTLNFSHICFCLWTDNQNQSFLKIPFNFEENFVNQIYDSVTLENQCCSKIFEPQKIVASRLVLLGVKVGIPGDGA